MPPINLVKGLGIKPSQVQGGLRGAITELDELPSKESGMVCRICLEEEDPNDHGRNPFICPCSCTGSMKFIHVKCVREWLDAKKQS